MSEEPSDKWENSAERIRVLSERLIRAGWIRGIAYDPKGMAVDWTEEGLGKMKMKQLWSLHLELGATTFTPQDQKALWHLMLFAAVHHRWV